MPGSRTATPTRTPSLPLPRPNADDPRNSAGQIPRPAPVRVRLPGAANCRPGTLDQFPVQLSLAPVRRVLRRLGLTPQRPQFRACQQNAAAVRTGSAATCPALARHAQEQGALLLWADEVGRTSHSHRGTPWGPRAGRPASGGEAAGPDGSPAPGALGADPASPRSPLKKSGRRTQLASGGAAAHSKHRYWPVARSWGSVLPQLRARRNAAPPSSSEPKTFSTGS